MAVVKSAGVVHGQHVAVFGLHSAFFRGADNVDLEFGDLRAREGSPDQRQNSEYACQRHGELTKSLSVSRKKTRALSSAARVQLSGFNLNSDKVCCLPLCRSEAFAVSLYSRGREVIERDEWRSVSARAG